MKAILFFLRYIILYISYTLFIPALLFCVATFMMILININDGNLTFMQFPGVYWFFQWLGITDTGSFGTADIVNAYVKVSFIFMIIVEIVCFSARKFKIKFSLKKPSWLFSGYTIMTLLSLLYYISAFLPSAKPGATSIIPMFIFLWLVAMSSYYVSNCIKKIT